MGKDPRLAEFLDPHGAELLMASALLHDLGHWPFCHAIEDLSLAEFTSYEAYASEFLAPHCELAQVRKSHRDIGPAEILDVLAGGTDTPAL